MIGIDNTDHTKFEVVPNPSAVNIDRTIAGPHSDLEMRDKVVCYLRELLHVVQSSYHEDVVELNFIQSGSLLIEFYEWRRKKTQELMQALCSGHLDPEDLSLVSDYMSGHVNSDAIFPPNGAFPLCSGSQSVSLDNDSEDDEDERRLDENSLLKYAVDEVNILKRVLELKRDGLWSIDDSSCGTAETGSIDISTSISLVPPSEPTCRTYSDYMFAEINWLAEDFKRERQWKRVSAKKLALTALKCCRDKSERALKIEKEEVVRIRKMCAFIAKMIRDWWRQMDKIVQAKQQVRLTAKRQQAISSHLGQVLETTEEYTRWLTEGITSSKPEKTIVSSIKSSGGNNQNENVSDSGQRILKSPVKELDTSDEEFTADEVALTEVDDEETIEQEEKIATEDQHGSETSTAVELEQLASDADCPLEDLLPPGYLEFITSNSSVIPEAQYSSASEVNDSGEPYNRDRIEAHTCSSEIPKECQYSEKSEETKYEANVSVSEKKELDILKLEVSLSVKETMINSANKDEPNLEIASNTFDVESNSQSLLTKEIDDADNEVDLANSNVNECSSVKNGSVITLKKLMDHEVNASVMEAENNTDVVFTNSKCEETQKSSCQTSAGEPNVESTTNEGKNVSSGVGLATVSSPFLLSGGNLREYQLVGLSWLVATYDKRLNGILADEMGLGKTIQTISLLAYLACERGVWGPHLIVVPTSVILNWEVEFKRWCPSFKILTYFGNMKERKCKRKGWTKTNAFHVCITSYRLAIQDAIAFKRKKWKYLILDEAQNIKNFKSQRWQTLLTFNSQRRLLLTGTPLQNSLMELWSLMHFLMPNIFQSHRDFQEWFASPITGMIEGNTDHNELLVQRLHKVLRPFLLRRLKADVERQLPRKYEHVIMCRLSRRQRFLYDDFMSLGSTQETLKSGQFLSVMNILMQLRKVCNHPNLFETRPIISPFRVADSYLTYSLPRLLVSMSHPFLVFAPSSNGSRSVFGSASAFSDPDLDWLDTAGSVARLLGQTMNLVEMARDLPGFVAKRCRQLCARENLITIIDSSDVIDDVTSQRIQFNEMKKSRKSQGEYLNRSPFFDSKCFVYSDGYYPALSSPTNLEPTIVKVDFPKNSWDIGMPKSCLRRRFVERHNRLLLMSRINERRCDLTFKSHSNDVGTYWDHGTHIGPDLIFLINRLMLEKPSEDLQDVHIYPGLINGTVCCRQSLHTWPVKSSSLSSVISSTVDQISCFEGNIHQMSSLSLESIGSRRTSYLQSSHSLREMLHSPGDYLNDLREILKRFVFVVPAVISSGCLHPSFFPMNSSEYHERKTFNRLTTWSPQMWLMPSKLHQLVMSCRIQFPDPRLIQYDCGKLQRLHSLLRELKSGNHRVLIFTQMARMLDILEQFLAYHGHRYLRLDGTTKVEQRQVLMERFNQDSQIFVFILSTRSGGLGINLTGADTVIFYDSDWNPTMDAQAQDRCHRIGQTRDVHIYRLISERTVEENILRKANQKRFLSDVAIEGGKFTTAFFKQNTITELFAEPSGLQDLAKMKGSATLVETSSLPHSDKKGTDSNFGSVPQSEDRVAVTGIVREIRPAGCMLSSTSASPRDVSANESTGPISNSEAQLEALLDACEEESDRIATRRVLDEAKADLAEFEEKSPYNEDNNDSIIADDNNSSNIPSVTAIEPFSCLRNCLQQSDEVNTASQNTNETLETIEQIVERELLGFESQLKPVERFGVRQVEEQREHMLNEQLDMADAELIESEKVWHLEKLKALHEADERRADLEDDDMFYCCGKYDLSSQLAELERLERIRMEETNDPDASINLLDSGQIFSSGRSKYPRKRPYDSCSTAHKTQARQVVCPGLSRTNKSTRSTSVGKVHKRLRLDKPKKPIDITFVSDSEKDEININQDISKRGKSTNQSTQIDIIESSKTGIEAFVEKMHFPPTVHSKRFHKSGIRNNNLYSRSNNPQSKTGACLQQDVISSRKLEKNYLSSRSYPVPELSEENVSYKGLEEIRHFDQSHYQYNRSTIQTQKRVDRRNTECHLPDKVFRFDEPNSVIFSNHYDPENVAHEEIVEANNLVELPFNQQSNNVLSDAFEVSVGSSIKLQSERIPGFHNDFPASEGLSPTGLSCPKYVGPPTTTTPGIHLQNRYQKSPDIPFRLLSPTTPLVQHPPEPMIPVQSIPDGSHLNLTARQVLASTGQPVFVITRQMKTPSGEIYQQRFTHPVAPPPQFTRMVYRLQKPSGIASRTSTLLETNRIRQPQLPTESSITCRPTVLSNSPTAGTLVMRPATKTINANVSPDPGLQDMATSVQHFAQPPRFSANGIKCATSIPVIRMINCDANKTSPIIRLVTSEINHINNDVTHSHNSQSVSALLTPTNTVRIGNTVRLIPNHISNSNTQVIRLQRVVSNLTHPKNT
ncbi:putative helicase [Schistosoma mansoni]|uniref:putative helicase n=1 Tax=Schistosoma mansoni TaxID=6183 RepID=UPI0001A632A9|nr:putative helicase [Schistosoma mansoni]|eukprot:XP_018648129.1 putative helicase [Schistosoma mansoni]